MATFPQRKGFGFLPTTTLSEFLEWCDENELHIFNEVSSQNQSLETQFESLKIQSDMKSFAYINITVKYDHRPGRKVHVTFHHSDQLLVDDIDDPIACERYVLCSFHSQTGVIVFDSVKNWNDMCLPLHYFEDPLDFVTDVNPELPLPQHPRNLLQVRQYLDSCDIDCHGFYYAQSPMELRSPHGQFFKYPFIILILHCDQDFFTLSYTLHFVDVIDQVHETLAACVTPIECVEPYYHDSYEAIKATLNTTSSIVFQRHQDSYHICCTH